MNRASRYPIRSNSGASSTSHHGRDGSNWYSGRARMSWRRASAWSSPTSGEWRRLELAHPLDDVGALASIAEIDEEQRVDDRPDTGQQDAGHGRDGAGDDGFGRTEPELPAERVVDGEWDGDERVQHGQHDRDDHAGNPQNRGDPKPMSIGELVAAAERGDWAFVFQYGSREVQRPAGRDVRQQPEWRGQDDQPLEPGAARAGSQPPEQQADDGNEAARDAKDGDDKQGGREQR